MASKRVELTITGRVQGVFFRASTQREAKRLGLTGWVENRADGGVEICAEGEAQLLEQLVAWAHHGPESARVDSVDVRWGSYVGDHRSFEIVG